MKTTIRQWASRNALTLTFILVLFIITWVWILVTELIYGKGLSG